MPVQGQRWSATADESVAAAILALRDDETFLERFWSKVDTRSAGDDECDVWTGAMSSEGYGVVRLGGRGSHVARAHRVAFILRRGVVPADRPILDHVYPICRYRFCVNEWHLEPVTVAVNNLRTHGTGRAPQRAMRYEALRARDVWERENARAA